jgi:carbon-monoxide dehydrogenase medium subunit
VSGSIGPAQAREFPGSWAFAQLARADVTCPRTVEGLEDAVAAGRVPFAGATDLLIRSMHQGGDLPPLAWTLAVPELSAVEAEDGLLRLGAAVTMRQAAASSAIRVSLPALAESAAVVGSVQIRTRATVVGNLCNASPAADTVPALAVHEATVQIRGAGTRRTVPVTEFVTAPGRIQLTPNEFVSGLQLRPVGEREASSYRRFTVRASMDLAFVGVAVRLRLGADGETIEDAAIALAAVGPTVLMANEAARLLIGRKPDPVLLRDCGEAAALGCRPITDLRASAAYRRRLVAVLVGDAVVEAHRRART